MSFQLTTLIDLAIGTVFVLVLVSMIVSYANEILAKMLRWRAKTLREGVGNLLFDPEFNALGKLVLEHPLVNSLKRNGTGPRGEDPSYIPSNIFARALIDTLNTAARVPPGQHGVMRDGRTLQRGGTVIAQNSDHLTQQATRLPETEAIMKPPAHLAVPDLLASLPDGPLKTTLTALSDAAGDDIRAFEASLAKWFDDGMDRVSGWYKRGVQQTMFVIALALCVGLNINIVAIADALWSQPQLSEQVAAQAARAYAELTTSPDSAQQVTDILNQVQDEVGLPLGWRSRPDAMDLLFFSPGWILTAILASLGAPFWFNLLRQLLDLRGAGPRPQRPQTDAPHPTNAL